MLIKVNRVIIEMQGMQGEIMYDFFFHLFDIDILNLAPLKLFRTNAPMLPFSTKCCMTSRLPRKTNSREAGDELNSSKDDDNAQGNWSTFALKFPNSRNFNPLSLMLIPSIDIRIRYNFVENRFH